MGSIDVKVDIVELQLGDGVRDALLVDGRSLGAELDSLAVGDNVGERVRLQDDGEGKVVRGRKLLGVGLNELLLVDFKTVLITLQLAGGFACRAVTVGEVIQNLFSHISPARGAERINWTHQADDVLLAGLLLGSAGPLNGGVDARETLSVGDPNKGTDILDGANPGGVLLISRLLERGESLIELLGVVRVDVELAALERRRGIGDRLDGLFGLFRLSRRGGLLRSGLIGCAGLLGGRLSGSGDLGGLGSFRRLGNGRGVVLTAGEARVGGDKASGRECRENSSSTHFERGII